MIKRISRRHNGRGVSIQSCIPFILTLMSMVPLITGFRRNFGVSKSKPTCRTTNSSFCFQSSRSRANRLILCTTSVLRGGAAVESETEDFGDMQQKDSSKEKVKSSKKKKKAKKPKAQNKSKQKPTKLDSPSSGSSRTRDKVSSKSASKQVMENKKKIEEILKTDTADMLGDAIRERGDQLLSSGNNDRWSGGSRLVHEIDDTVRSVGWALGSSDKLSSIMEKQKKRSSARMMESDNDDLNMGGETGNVEASTTSVFVHYFMRSHGGAHALQSVCSLLAALTGVGAIGSPLMMMQTTKKGDANSLLKDPVSDTALGLIKRCLVFAMMKHISGLLATGAMAARAIPEVGLRNARLWIQDLVYDPISQYVFYCACVFLWLANAQQQHHRWWQAYSVVPLCLAGPVVFREVINTIYVLSDVLVLWKCTNQNDEQETTTAFVTLLNRAIGMSKYFVDAFMSILVTSDIWRSADAMQRQAIVAKLVGRISLAGEVLVGMLMTLDSFASLFFALYRTKGTDKGVPPPSLGTLLKSFLCTQLYLRFLLVRRRKIVRLATQIRGGASKFPLFVLDVLLDPAAKMGLKTEKTAAKPSNTTITWKDWVLTSLGLDDDDFSKDRKKRMR